MTERFDSHRSIIQAWPKLTDFAGDIAIPYETAKAMRRRDRIQAEYWTAVVAAAELRGIDGVTCETLALLAAAKRKGAS